LKSKQGLGPVVADLLVTGNDEIARGIWRLKLFSPWEVGSVLPGQFLHLQCGDGGVSFLRRPLSIENVVAVSRSGSDLESGSGSGSGSEIHIIYRVVGQGTKELSMIRPGGGRTLNSLGPLGNGFEIEKLAEDATVLLVGGGVGVPPLYYLGLEIKKQKKNAKIITLLGFRNAAESFLLEEFLALGEVFHTTDEGDAGLKGNTMVALPQIGAWDTMYACGPTPMLKALQKEPRMASEGSFISLEQRMGCGIGACLACIVRPVSAAPTEYSVCRVCKEGPVFPLRSVIL
jgi:dihydroorotate dehydrogenase electron transfer subunit